MKETVWAVFAAVAAGTVLLACTRASAQEPKIPFPRALDAAAVSVAQLDSILDHALLLGNGDINALLHSDGGAVVLKLTKNDVWDARLDAKLNPPLPTMKRIKEMAASGELGAGGRAWILPKGSKWKPPDSYHAHAYPCPRLCGVVRIGTGPARPWWRCIRRQGRHSAFERRKDVTVMSIRGRQGQSCGWAWAPLAVSTDTYRKLRVRLSGSENARHYVDVMAPGKGNVGGTGKWRESPTEPTDVVLDLAPGSVVERVILYTWTEDGKTAENRYESVVFEGPGGRKLPVDLAVTPPPTCGGKLDIRRAAADVLGAKGRLPKARVRALADRNVFLIETSAPVTLEGAKSADIPAFAAGRREGVRWLTQEIPGDDDWAGMRFAVALAGDDRAERKAVAIVTSREAKDPLAAAVALARAALQADPAGLIESHEARWRRFWSASGVDVGDPLLRDAWYRNLYFLRCVTRPGVVSPGLFAGLIHDRPAWHGDYHTNYNIQQTFWTAYVTNHPDLAEPYDRLVREYLPRGRWLARQVFDCGGAYYPHVLFAYEPPEPGKCKAPYGRQYIHHVWGFTLGVNGFTAQPLWWHYKYAPDRELLAKTVYPVIRDVAVFYADFLDTCKRGKSGKVALGPSVSPEHWGWTKDFARNYNGAFDIAMIRCTLAAAIEAAGTLGEDERLVARFGKALALLPDYPTAEVTVKGKGKDGQPSTHKIVVDMQGAPPINYNIAVPACAVFPADVVTWFSPDEQKRLFARTIERLRWNGNNSSIILSVARARLSLPKTTDWVRAALAARLRPNGTFTLNRLGAGINAYGHYTEQFAASMAVSELLIQSVGDVIRVFPAWPKEKPASFRSLRAQGGFLVSAEQKAGRVGPVTVDATVGGRLRLLSPWPRIGVRRGDARTPQPLRPDARGIVDLDTRPGELLVFRPGK